MLVYPEVRGSGLSRQGEGQGWTSQYIHGMAPIPEDQDFSAPYSDRDPDGGLIKGPSPNSIQHGPKVVQPFNPNSIGSFKGLGQAFINKYISGRVHEKSSASFINLKPWTKKSLKEYLNRFKKKALKVPDIGDEVDIIVLQQGTKNGLFKMSLAKYASESMLQLHERARKYIKMEGSIKKTIMNNKPTGNKK
ncbi:hypothetical protein AgCh_039378 [Apium graveolens]